MSAPIFSARASITIKPALCLVFSYSFPGFPRPAIINIFISFSNFRWPPCLPCRGQCRILFFKTVTHLRGLFPKSPDFYILSVLNVQCKRQLWQESAASNSVMTPIPSMITAVSGRFFYILYSFFILRQIPPDVPSESCGICTFALIPCAFRVMECIYS